MKHAELKIRNSKLGHAGVTLIEILLATGVFAILGIGIATTMYLYTIYAEELPQERLRAGALRAHQSALESIKRNVRESGEILPNATIGGNLHTTATTTLVLRRRAIGADGFVLMHQHDLVVYALSGVNPPFVLRKFVQPSPDSAAQRVETILSSAVRELAFSYNHAELGRATSVRVRLVTEKRDQVNTSTVTSTIRATLH